MEPRSKLWVEKDGKLVLSSYRVQLLRMIDETGSLAEAASRMDLSYRRAWGKLREMEENLGMKLVERSKGGTGGGGSRLTPEGRSMIDQFERFREAAERDVAQEFSNLFEDSTR